MKLVIVGAVGGGASAATRARRLSEDSQIILVERGGDVSFANCGLPYYIGGEIVNRDKLLVVSADRLRARFNLDVRVHSNVEAIDRHARTVRIRDLRSGQAYDESYDKLVLSPGATPRRPPIPGIDLPGILTLRDLRDMDAIVAKLGHGVREALVVGAGFIGLELVENLARKGVQCTLVELQEQVLPPLDKEMTTPVAQELAKQGVRLHLADSVTAFELSKEGLTYQLRSGTRGRAELVILGVGVQPESGLARDSGLEVGERGGIRVNEYLQTSDPHIYAVGDAIEVVDFVTGERTQIPLASPANRQGRLAADNLLGRPSAYRGTQGTAIVRVFDLTAAATGASEKTLRRLQRPFRKVYVHPANHAGYYPGARGMSIKLLFAPQGGKILGAQIVGGDGVDKRVDVLSVAIQARMSVFQLEEMELAYAPPYGAAKDPVNMAGFVAAGLIRDDHPQVDVEYVLDTQPFLVDVRTQEEFASGHIPSAVWLPVDELRSRWTELPRDRQIVVYCQVGQRGYLATRMLRQKGLNAVNLGGGYRTFQLHVPSNPPS